MLASSLRSALRVSSKVQPRLANLPFSSLPQVAARFSSSGSDGSKQSRFSQRSRAFVGASAMIAAGACLAMGVASAQEQKDKKEEGKLDPDNFQKFTVTEVIDVSPNTKVFRFALGSKSEKLNLPVASFVLAKAPFNDANGKPIVRPYTPISESDARGHFDLLIKSYDAGLLSKHFGSLKVGDQVELKGPIVKMRYETNMKKRIAMIAGGTGITPMLQVAREVVNNPNDKTDITLIFANIAEQDILLRKELDELARKHKNFHVHYVLENPPANWQQSVGRVSLDLIKKKVPGPSDDTLVMVCGPPGMVAAISGPKAPDYSQGELAGFLKEAGFSKEQVFKF